MEFGPFGELFETQTLNQMCPFRDLPPGGFTKGPSCPHVAFVKKEPFLPRGTPHLKKLEESFSGTQIFRGVVALTEGPSLAQQRPRSGHVAGSAPPPV